MPNMLYLALTLNLPPRLPVMREYSTFCGFTWPAQWRIDFFLPQQSIESSHDCGIAITVTAGVFMVTLASYHKLSMELP